jgi:hypothetical protein
LNGSKLLVGSANMTFNGTTLTAGGLTTTGTTSTGVLSVTGNTTLGDAAADTVTVNGTITSNLIFTDNTYDIGASGATRPRSGFFGTSLTAGTTINAAGAIKSTGANLVNEASAIKISQETTAISRVSAYGNDASTQGSLQIRTISSDGTASATPALFSSTGLAVTGAISATGNISVQDNLSVVLGTSGGAVSISHLTPGVPRLAFTAGGSEKMALTDGGLLGIGTNSPQAKLELYSTADANFGQKIYHVSTALGTNRFPQLEFIQTPTGQSYQNTVILRQQNSTYGNYPSLAFITNSAGAGENTRVFLDGYTGYLGIGATNPSTNLMIGGTAASGGAGGGLGVFLSRGAATNFYEAFDGTKSFIAGVDNTLSYAKVGTLSQHPVALVAGNGNGSFYLNTSCDAGLGVVPASWASDWTMLQIGSLAGIGQYNSTPSTMLTLNYYNDTAGGGGAKYLANGFASVYQQASGNHFWYTSSNNTSGAGAALTLNNAMTLTAARQLLIGSASAAGSLANDTLQVGSGLSGITNTGSALAPTIVTSGSLEFNFDGVSGSQRHGRICGNAGNGVGGAYGGGMAFEYYAFNGSTYQWYTGAYLDSGGNFLIGDSSGTQRLVVSKSDSGAYVARFSNTTGSNANGILINTPNRAGSNGLYGLTVANSAGNAFAIYTDGTYGTISDINRKKNVETARDGYLTDLCALRVVKYNWKEQEDSEPKNIGFIAQEVEQVFAGMVQTDSNGQKMLIQPVFIPVLVKAIQEQQAIIESLKARLDAANL